MHTIDSAPTSVLEHRHLRVNRSRTVSTKLTDSEFRQIERLAASKNQWLSEWVRDVLLDTARNPQPQQNVALFAEVQALRLLLINTLEPIARGEKMSPEQFKEMLRYVKANKRRAAADALASYVEGTTE